MSTSCPKTCALKPYVKRQFSRQRIDGNTCGHISYWHDCWANIRIAVGGKKEVDRLAFKYEWLELPEHIRYQMNQRSDKYAAEFAKKNALQYYRRTPYDESVKVAIAITKGAVFRVDTEYEGFNSTFGLQQLDAAETSFPNFARTERFLLDERLTTGFTATYIFNREIDGQVTQSIKHYCAENIDKLGYDENEQLNYARFVEYVDAETDDQDLFCEAGKVKTYRELKIEDGIVVERIWREDDAAEGEFDIDVDSPIVVRGENLLEIPVVVIGGPYPSSPPFESLFEKTRELYQVSSKIEFRHSRMGAPIMQINYTDTGELSYVCSSREQRGVGSTANNAEASDIDDEPAVVVPGIALETQNTQIQYIYDDGTGLAPLEAKYARAKEDLERLGGHYGITNTASNVSEGTERMRQGREAAFITNYIVDVSEGLTRIARWVRFFSSAVEDAVLSAINITLNTQLSDTGPEFTLTDVRDLFASGVIDGLMAIRLLRILLPSEVFEEDMTDEQIMQRIQGAEFVDTFGGSDSDVADNG